MLNILKMDEPLAFLVTWVTFHSRISKRTAELGIKQSEGVFLDSEEEIKITNTIKDIVTKEGLKVLAYNICGDHIHMVIICTQDELSKVVQKLKGISSRIYHKENFLNEANFLNKGFKPLVQKEEGCNHLWAQKFNTSFIYNEKQLSNTVDYVIHNREKHNLSNNKTLSAIIQKIIIPYEKAFKNDI